MNDYKIVQILLRLSRSRARLYHVYTSYYAYAMSMKTRKLSLINMWRYALLVLFLFARFFRMNDKLTRLYKKENCLEYKYNPDIPRYIQSIRKLFKQNVEYHKQVSQGMHTESSIISSIESINNLTKKRPVY